MKECCNYYSNKSFFRKYFESEPHLKRINYNYCPECGEKLRQNGKTTCTFCNSDQMYLITKIYPPSQKTMENPLGLKDFVLWQCLDCNKVMKIE